MAIFATSTNFAFADIDFGLDNGDAADFRGFLISVPQCGSFEQVRSPFRFPGVDGEWSRDLGRAGKTDVWEILLIAESNADLVSFEEAVESVKTDGKTHGYTVRGRTFDRAFIEEFVQLGKREGVSGMGDFIFAQRYQIVFRVLP